ALATAGGDRRVGVAVFPAPSRDGTAAKRWAVAQISLEAYATTSPMSAKDRRERVRVQDASAGELGREARSLRLVSGRAHARAVTAMSPIEGWARRRRIAPP